MDLNNRKSNDASQMMVFSRKANAYRSLPIRFKYEPELESHDRRTVLEQPSVVVPPFDEIQMQQSSSSVEVDQQQEQPQQPSEGNSSVSSDTSNTLKELDCNINDCLQDLDKYLEEIDTNSLVFKSDEDPQHNHPDRLGSPVDSFGHIEPNRPYTVLDSVIEGHEVHQRSHHFRRTMGNIKRRAANGPVENEPIDDQSSSQLWRCKSARELMTSSIRERQSAELRPSEVLTQEQIFSNILNECSNSSETRPRQFGRRATGQPTVLALRSNLINRPASAPTNHFSYAQVSSPLHQPYLPPHLIHRENEMIASSSLLDSEASSFRSSHIPSPFSTVSTTDSDSSSSSFSTGSGPGSNREIITSTNIHEQQDNGERLEPIISQSEPTELSSGIPPLPNTIDSTTATNFDCNGEWPHMVSQLFALCSCTLGLCNLCRFCVLVINYGGSFVLQFFVLSCLFGIPLFWLFMSLGSRIKSGPISMWKISPVCKGIGLALILIQFIISIYSSVAIAWILVYIRDSFPKSYEFSTKLYRLQENGLSTQYIIQNLTKDVSDYFHIEVLQRLDGERSGFKVSDQLALYLFVVWIMVFIVLCKGLRSLGKFTYLLTTVPIGIFVVIIVKMVFFMDSSNVKTLFSTLDINDFASKQSWIAAAQETFLTWGLLGPSVIAITSRTHASANKFTLRRNALIVVLITYLVLFLAMVLGLCSINILKDSSLVYIPGSYDNAGRYTSIYSKASINPELLSFPTMLVPHYSSFLGEVYRRPFAVAHNESGYQALRFISEIFPAIIALSSTSFTWVWIFLTLAMFLLFGLAQLCVMWKPISSVLGNSTTSVLLSTVTGLMLSIPFATEMGIRILHYIDLLFGASWIVPILWTLLIFGVFLVRGRPYNGDDLVNDLKMTTSISAFLALAWNIMLPIGLPILAIVTYRASNSKQFYHMNGRTALSPWARKLAGSMQLSILLLVPIIAIIQTIRYLSKGPSDLFVRIQLLYRPSDETNISRNHTTNNQNFTNSRQNRSSGDFFPSIQHQDSPPKYTPPPSYTTATGARIAKFIRQSIRRSVRRIRSASHYSRSSPFEPEAEMIVPDLPNTQRSLNADYTGTAEDSLDSPANTTNELELEQQQRQQQQSSLEPRQKNITNRVSSLPRIMQHSALINDIIIRPSSLTSRTQRTNRTSEFRSIENLTQNAEPLAQSQPPARDSLENSRSSS